MSVVEAFCGWACELLGGCAGRLGAPDFPLFEPALG